MPTSDNLVTVEPPVEPRKASMRAGAMKRAAEAWQWRVLGKSWTEVAELVGFSNDANAIRAVRRFYGTLPTPSTDELRAMWRARLEHLWSLAQRDAQAARPGALRAGVAIADRASKLDGLDAPARFEVSAASAELNEIVHVILRAQGVELDAEADVFGDVVDAEVID